MIKANEHTSDPAHFSALAKDLLRHAMKGGAEAAEVVIVRSRSLDVTAREGTLEDVESAESQDLGLRVLMGKHQAGISSSDLSPASLEKLAERACAMAKAAPEDPYCGLADPDQLAKNHPDLNLYDPATPDIDSLTEAALATEAAALSVKNISKSGGASAGWSTSAVSICASNGFEATRQNTSHGHSVMVIAERDGAMERDWAQSTAHWAEDLRSVEEVGLEAGTRTAARLGAVKLQSASMAVMFEPRTARSLLGMLLGAITGPSVARGISFLKDKMGEQVFAPGFDIVEDPFRHRGLGSSAVDGEGLARRKRHLVKDGHLTTWLHSLSSARQMGEAPTGHAALGLGGPPGVGTTNVHIAPGTKSPGELMAEIGNGLIVTDAFGPSFNAGTGDWSVGIAGFEIKNGMRAGAINEMTVAGNLLDIYARLIAANDLEFRSSANTPSLLIEGLSVAGQ
ncbi:MAG: modulator protein [Robiginitomaculum sp.]|nr:MAG: modulator protein [Robiginitomaculum sp.]